MAWHLAVIDHAAQVGALRYLRGARAPEAEARRRDVLRKLANEGFDAYLCERTFRVRQGRGRRRKVVERICNLFPGYLFVEVPAGGSLAALEDVAGIVDLVRFGEGPAEVPAMLIGDLRAAAAMGCFVEDERTGRYDWIKAGTPAQAYARFKRGDSVKVLDGPFGSFVGAVLDCDDQRGRITVLLSIFGRETPAVLDVGQVEEAEVVARKRPVRRRA